MTRLRTIYISSHRLQIEIGRNIIPKTPIRGRLCKHCSDNLVEHEVHLLLGCSKFNDFRRYVVLTTGALDTELPPFLTCIIQYCKRI